MRNPDDIAADLVAHFRWDNNTAFDDDPPRSDDYAALPRLLADIPDLLAEVSRLKADNERERDGSAQMYAKWMACFDAARKAEAERDALRAVVDAVQALCEYAAADLITVSNQVWADALRVALGAATGVQGPQDDPLCSECGAPEHAAQHVRPAAGLAGAVPTEPAEEQR